MRGIGVIIILAVLAIPVIQAAELGDYQFYDNTQSLFTKIGKNSFSMTSAMKSKDYEKVKEIAETLTVAIDVYNLKWNLYKLSPQTKPVYDEVGSTLTTYRAGLQNTIKSMDSLMSGNVPLANQYIDQATLEISDAQTHIDKVIELIP